MRTMLFKIPENPDVILLLRELKEFRIQIYSLSKAIKYLSLNSKLFNKKRFIIDVYLNEIQALRMKQKANRLILKNYYYGV